MDDRDHFAITVFFACRYPVSRKITVFSTGLYRHEETKASSLKSFIFPPNDACQQLNLLSDFHPEYCFVGKFLFHTPGDLATDSKIGVRPEASYEARRNVMGGHMQRLAFVPIHHFDLMHDQRRPTSAERNRGESAHASPPFLASGG
ncbi:hypothetical protein HLH26_19275 [Gluconacetobacter sp. 1b LMG 1731]|uniref:Uncharacterized protein n=2 Tax=Gluconacetobacter dulcium TaxID=2729096 RepID=A0A7W4IPE5_9PROT|nr:hypothetical protein [Gluconacetobacter dulcium]MBB2195728.1 hypothetical protein [Gluconacetobacter dulcium]